MKMKDSQTGLVVKAEDMVMLQETQASLSLLQPKHWQSRVVHFLQQRIAVSAKEISDCLGAQVDLVCGCLARLEQDGQVEVLRPFGRTVEAMPDLTYWRWRRPEDDRCRWQTQLHRNRRASMRDLRITLTESIE